MKFKKLSEIATISSGGTPSRTVSIYFDGDILWVKSGELKENTILDTEEKISLDGLRNSSAKIVPAGTVLLALYGANVGRVAMLGVDAATNQAVSTIQCKETILHNGYLFYFLSSCKEKLIDKAAGGAQQNISQGILSDLEIPLPPLDEQQRIAQVLDQADRLRRLRRHSTQQTETFLQSVFIEMFGEYLTSKTNNTFKDVLLMPLNNGFFAKNEFYGSGTPVIWVDNLYHTISVDTEGLRQAKDIDEKTFKKYEVKENDLLFTRSSLVREGVGQVNIIPRLEVRTLFECHIIRARVDRTIANPYYLLGLYRCAYGKQLILQKAKTSTMTTISQDDLNELLPRRMNS